MTKVRIEPRMPNGSKLAVTGDDLSKFNYLLEHYNVKPTELIRMLIRKDFKVVFKTNG